MKKVILGLFILATMITVSEEKYDLGIENVKAKDERQYESTIELKVNKDNEGIESPKLEIKNKKVNLLKDLGIEKIKIDKEVIPELALNYNIKIYSAEKNSNVIIRDKNDKGENYLTFGLGGYHKIDSFKYILDYKKEEKAKEITYFLHIGRNIRGEDRNNDDQSIDNYYGKLWYKKLDVALSHIITDEEFPGKKSTPVNDSYIKGNETSINLNYNIENEKNSNIILNANAYGKIATSDSKIREYKNDFFEIKGVYEKDNYTIKNTENYTELGLNYYTEKLEEENINSISLYGKDYMKLKNNKKWNFDIALGTEIINGDKNENNFMLKLKANKEINKKINVTFGIEKNDFQKSVKELMNTFEFDNDILPFKLSGLENEKNIVTELEIFYNEDKYYLEGKIKNKNVENKIVYNEDTSITNEIAIAIINNVKKLNWQELELKGSYTYNDNYRGEMKYVYSTLDKINFNPQNKFNLNLIYNNNNYKLNLEGMYYSKMYADRENDEKIEDCRLINLYNSYQFTETLNLNLKFLNLLDSNSSKKEEYSIFSRKILLEFKINY